MLAWFLRFYIFLSLPPYHLIILSLCHPVTLSSCRLVILSPCYIACCVKVLEGPAVTPSVTGNPYSKQAYYGGGGGSSGNSTTRIGGGTISVVSIDANRDPDEVRGYQYEVREVLMDEQIQWYQCMCVGEVTMLAAAVAEKVDAARHGSHCQIVLIAVSIELTKAFGHKRMQEVA